LPPQLGCPNSPQFSQTLLPSICTLRHSFIEKNSLFFKRSMYKRSLLGLWSKIVFYPAKECCYKGSFMSDFG
jgi:hypothetical protein